MICVVGGQQGHMKKDCLMLLHKNVQVYLLLVPLPVKPICAKDCGHRRHVDGQGQVCCIPQKCERTDRE